MVLFPNYGDDYPLDPCLTPRPLLWCFKGKEPQMIIAPTYIPHAEPVMTYTDDARSVSSSVTHHHGLWVWEQMAGDGWWETGWTHSLSGIRALDYIIKI